MTGKKRADRPRRVDRIGARLVDRAERQASLSGKRKKPLRKNERGARERALIAYDLETTNIAVGNPRPLYITAYSEASEFFYSGAVQADEHGGLASLARILDTYFLTPEYNGARFIAWNGNKFDAYLIGAALLHDERFTLRPYLTRSKNLRGLRVDLKPAHFPEGYKKKKLSWEFLDGIAMTGILKPLKDFLKTFAPSYQKLDGPDFERETFDASNAAHVEYAERDSIGLYHAILAAQKIVFDKFGVPLQPTIGNTGIRIFQREMPWNVVCWSPPLEVTKLIRDVVMRGGYCHCVRRYNGPIWKYDLNQAYAAAMRDSWLPAGTCYHKPKATYNPLMVCSIYKVRAFKRDNAIPFYYTSAETKLRTFATDTIDDTWLTSTEVQQLHAERWQVKILDCYYWDDQFTMRDYVNKLEALRGAAPDGPSGAEGTMIKNIGNNSYGKTVEVLGGVELVMSKECPEGFYEYQCEDDAFQHIWFKFSPAQAREYHQPQIGAFITAHVRMTVRRAALLAPEAFLYADTDCVVFSEAVEMNTDPKRYGFWKVEVEGERYRLIGKKIYASLDGKTKCAKGLNVSKLTPDDYARWFDGHAPVQRQIQRQNFVKVMTGMNMFLEREREGTGNARLAVSSRNEKENRALF